MTTKYLGKDLVAEYGSADISGKYTAITINEEAPEANRIDVSDKGSTEIETEEGLPGQPKTTVSLTANDEESAASAILDLAVNDLDTLEIYPEGKTHGKPLRTINNVRLGSRRMSTGYQSKAEWQLEFYSYESITDTTYSTV